jgi:RNA polymerase sigma factor (sigma-70 family)
MTVSEYNQSVDLYADGLYRFLLRSVRDREKARDLVQETFARLWTKADDVAFEKAKSYIFTAGYHIMIDQMRREKRQLDYAKEELHTAQKATGRQYSDLSEILNEALDTLPPIQKSVIMLRDYEGYSYEDIGQITGLTESQVKVYIYRGRLALKAYIGKPENVI